MDDYESEFLENALFYFLTVTENSYLSTLGGSNVGQCDFFFFTTSSVLFESCGRLP